jgi:hypothetical protein
MARAEEYMSILPELFFVAMVTTTVATTVLLGTFIVIGFHYVRKRLRRWFDSQSPDG